MVDATSSAAGPLVPFAVIGDVHGRINSLARGAAHAFSAEVSHLVQVGDYWLYETRYARMKVDRTLASLAVEAGLDPGGVRLYFCDGNHEHFGILDPNADQPVELSEHVTYVPRGLALSIEDWRVGFCGGAESIDRARRTAGTSWWPDERMTDTQIARATAMGPVDVLVTHDTSTAVFDQLVTHSAHARGKHAFGDRERGAIDAILTATTPAWHVHGHHHIWGLFHTTRGANAGKGTTTVSLAADARPGAAALLGADTATVYPAPGRLAGQPHGVDLTVTPLT